MANEPVATSKISAPRATAYTFQLPALAIPHSSLTDGTEIPPPPPSPPPSPPPALNTRHPLASHPTSSAESSPAPSRSAARAALSNGSTPATPTAPAGVTSNPQAGAGAAAAAQHKRVPTGSSVGTSPPSKRRAFLAPSIASSRASGAPHPIRKLLGLRAVSRANDSTDSLVASPLSPGADSGGSPGDGGAGAGRPQSPGSPSLRRRRSGAFWRKASLFSLGGHAVAEEDEGGAGGRRPGTPPPTLPAISQLRSGGDEKGPAKQPENDGWLDGGMFKDIK